MKEAIIILLTIFILFLFPALFWLAIKIFAVLVVVSLLCDLIN